MNQKTSFGGLNTQYASKRKLPEEEIDPRSLNRR